MKKYERAIKAFWEVFDDETANTYEDMECELQSYDLTEDEWNFLQKQWDSLLASRIPTVDIEYQFELGALRTKVAVTYSRLGCKSYTQSINLRGIVDKNVIEVLMNLGRSVPMSWGHIKYNEPREAK